jgi:hypothetical protein
VRGSVAEARVESLSHRGMQVRWWCRVLRTCHRLTGVEPDGELNDTESIEKLDVCLSDCPSLGSFLESMLSIPAWSSLGSFL